MKHRCRPLNEDPEYSKISKEITTILKQCGIKTYNGKCTGDEDELTYSCYDMNGANSLGTLNLYAFKDHLYVSFPRDETEIDHELELCERQINVIRNIKNYETELISLLLNEQPEIEDVSKQKDEDATYFTVFGKYRGTSFEVQYNTFDREFVFDKYSKKEFSDSELDEIENACHLYLVKNFKEYR